MTHGYFFKSMTYDKSDPILLFNYLRSSYYSYSEFYGNTFIALIPFSIIAPLYLSYVLQIPLIQSMLIAPLLSLVIAIFCLHSSYVAYREYHKAKLSLISGYLVGSPPAVPPAKVVI